MKTKQWLLGCCLVLTLACSDDNKQTITGNRVNTGSGIHNSTATSATIVKQKTPNTEVKMPGYLEQNWTHETRMQWWFTSQGSRLLPYDWFFALERPDSQEMLASKDNLERYRFVAWSADPQWNPDGLPIGFVADTDAEEGSKTRYLGFTCAACHTGKVAYQDNEYIIEGAPAHHDFDGFITEVATSMQATINNSEKFSRFSNRVLGENAVTSQIAGLKADLVQESVKAGTRVKNNKSPHASGYARLDAFGSIFNEVVVTAINETANAKPADAPVSYPMLWDTPQHDKVQWNGSAVNAGIGVYVRNVGEVIGVYGGLEINKSPSDGMSLMFKNHANIGKLTQLEEILTTLWSPLWPEKLLPRIDQVKVQPGKQLYDDNCVNCHHGIHRDDPNRKVEATMVPVNEIGTDSTMASNIVKRRSKSGRLEGQPLSKLCSLTEMEKLGPETLSLQLVRIGVSGVLQTALDKSVLKDGGKLYVLANHKATCKDNCDPNTDAARCARPPGYKARPLNGIWASAPYLHNGSVPNLWALLQKPDQRPTKFNVGSWEFDPVNVGFATKSEPATSEFDTSVPGNSNAGHTYGNGLSEKEKWELIEYLKTL